MGDDSSFADGSASDEDDTRPLRLCPDAGCWGLEVMRCLCWGPAANWDGGMALAELVGCSVRDKQGGSSPPAEGQGSDGRGMAGKQASQGGQMSLLCRILSPQRRATAARWNVLLMAVFTIPTGM
ncbi:uncharacterized protein JN550_002628 [Neoarthrinium moseri]|uniref:uncharacterized protein n=1 Tax=Neoarthrinium moseri TaxID=1658444 RepID=UPI001FDC1963|nr:uncharacterized protein JN550_002628 [Neoarthrinium moseri]KAI1874049.1 hypothetical protein JN550_002628 [Neoarthrinium moseri]